MAAAPSDDNNNISEEEQFTLSNIINSTEGKIMGVFCVAALGLGVRFGLKGGTLSAAGESLVGIEKQAATSALEKAAPRAEEAVDASDLALKAFVAGTALCGVTSAASVIAFRELTGIKTLVGVRESLETWLPGTREKITSSIGISFKPEYSKEETQVQDEEMRELGDYFDQAWAELEEQEAAAKKQSEEKEENWGVEDEFGRVLSRLQAEISNLLGMITGGASDSSSSSSSSDSGQADGSGDGGVVAGTDSKATNQE